LIFILTPTAMHLPGDAEKLGSSSNTRGNKGPIKDFYTLYPI
jgi:hypothetical protein